MAKAKSELEDAEQTNYELILSVNEGLKSLEPEKMAKRSSDRVFELEAKYARDIEEAREMKRLETKRMRK